MVRLTIYRSTEALLIMAGLHALLARVMSAVAENKHPDPEDEELLLSLSKWWSGRQALQAQGEKT